ncbi:MAG: tetratricopeptide repeat protein [Alphaproteobacteria bacterium]|nr:tetratricopeptide repeat protein [Alphaproteobacteria bacterium]
MDARSPTGVDARPPRLARWGARLLWVVVGCVLLLLLTEGALRAAGMWLAAHPDDSGEPAEFTLLAVGDSFTFGVAGIAFPRQLEQLLNAEAGRRRFRVVNVALPGANTTLITDELPAQVARHRPDVVLVTTGENNSWNAVRLEQGAPWHERLRYAVQRTRVYKLLDVAMAGWSSPSFHAGAPTLLEVQQAANYLTDFNDTVGDEYRQQADNAPAETPMTPAQRQMLGQAFQLEDELRYEDAMALFRQLIEEQPTNLEAYVGLQECLSRLGRYDEASDVMSRALYDTPGIVPNAAAFYELGITLDLADRHEEAVRAWVAGLKLFPRSQATFYVLGNSFWMRGQPVWRAMEVVADIPGIEENKLHAYLEHLSHMTEGYASEQVRGLVSDTFRADIDRIVDIVQAAGAQVIFSSYPEHAYAEVEEVARERKVPYVDFRPIFAKTFTDRSDYIGADGFHCNTAGYRLMAEVFADEVREVLELGPAEPTAVSAEPEPAGTP